MNRLLVGHSKCTGPEEMSILEKKIASLPASKASVQVSSETILEAESYFYKNEDDCCGIDLGESCH